MTQGYLWLALPVAIFLSSWFRIEVGLPMIFLLLLSLWRILVKRPDGLHTDGYEDVGSKRSAWLLLGAVTCYIIASGIGGLTAQLEYDHQFRNAVFLDLSRRDWPVAYSTEKDPQAMLCYYFGFWLPAALVSKITGSVLIGDVAQIIYAAWGTWIAICLICSSCQGKIWWRIFWIFILFNAWDIVTTIFFHNPDITLKEALTYPGQLVVLSTSNDNWGNSANSAIYHYIYNQGPAVWVVLTLLLHDLRKPGRLMLLFGMLPAFAPFPAIGLLPFMTWWLLRSWKSIFTVENATGFLIALLTSLFFLHNNNAGKLQLFCSPQDLPAFLGIGLLFFIISVGPYFPFIWKEIRGNVMYWLCFITPVIVSCFYLGKSPDMAWRSSMPLILLTCLLICRKSTEFHLMKLGRKLAYCFVIAVGSVSSVAIAIFMAENEQRCLNGERSTKATMMQGRLHHPNYNFCYNNFVADDDPDHPSLYRRWLMPRNVRVMTQEEVDARRIHKKEAEPPTACQEESL